MQRFAVARAAQPAGLAAPLSVGASRSMPVAGRIADGVHWLDLRRLEREAGFVPRLDRFAILP